MRRFILKGNIDRFKRLLEIEASPHLHKTLRKLLAKARRELALLDSAYFGSKPDYSLGHSTFMHSPVSTAERTMFKKALAESSRACLVIDPSPGLHIVDITDAYHKVTMTRREATIGRPLFEIFPDNPADPYADGVANAFESIKTAFQSRKPHVLPMLHYDIRNPEGVLMERYWQVTNTPLFDGDGEVRFVLHEVTDVTRQHQRRPLQQLSDLAQGWGRASIFNLACVTIPTVASIAC